MYYSLDHLEKKQNDWKNAGWEQRSTEDLLLQFIFMFWVYNTKISCP